MISISALAMDESGNPVPGDLIAGKFLIEDMLGQGGMGSVFLARHQVTERVVALKWVKMGEDIKQARLLREARSMARVSHPNIVEVLDAGEHEGGVYMAMDYVDGKDLYEYAARRMLPYQHAVDLLIPALRGIRAAHKVGIVHRDLKPANIVVCFDTKGQPMNTKVLDFGVAKLLTSSDGPKITKTGNMVGTPRYMAPEQLVGDPEVDNRTDVYSAGLVLYELITGRPPFASSGRRELAEDVMRGSLPPPEIFAQDLPSDVSRVIMKAAQARMENRYQSMAELLQALSPFASEDSQEEPRIAPLLSQKGSIPQQAPISSAAPTLQTDAPPRPQSADTEPEGLPSEPFTEEMDVTVKPGNRHHRSPSLAHSPVVEGQKPPTTAAGVASPRVPSPRHGRDARVVAVIALVAAGLGVLGTSAWLSNRDTKASSAPNAAEQNNGAPIPEEPELNVTPDNSSMPSKKEEPAEAVLADPSHNAPSGQTSPKTKQDRQAESKNSTTTRAPRRSTATGSPSGSPSHQVASPDKKKEERRKKRNRATACSAWKTFDAPLLISATSTRRDVCPQL